MYKTLLSLIVALLVSCNVPSSFANEPNASLDDTGKLRVVGSNEHDLILVDHRYHGVYVAIFVFDDATFAEVPNFLQMSVHPGELATSELYFEFDEDAVQSLTLDSHAGNDLVSVDASFPLTAFLGAGDDELIATHRTPSLILGQEGDDTITGSRLDDVHSWWSRQRRD